MSMKKSSSGFTVVELIVVVAVIAILAGVVYFGYGAWQIRAATNTLKTDLSSAASQLDNDRNWQNGYPLTEAAANGGKGLPKSKGTTYDYSYDASAKTYCLEATSDTVGVPTFHISSGDTAAREGSCP